MSSDTLLSLQQKVYKRYWLEFQCGFSHSSLSSFIPRFANCFEILGNIHVSSIGLSGAVKWIIEEHAVVSGVVQRIMKS